MSFTTDLSNSERKNDGDQGSCVYCNRPVVVSILSSDGNDLDHRAEMISDEISARLTRILSLTLSETRRDETSREEQLEIIRMADNHQSFSSMCSSCRDEQTNETIGSDLIIIVIVIILMVSRHVHDSCKSAHRNETSVAIDNTWRNRFIFFMCNLLLND
jgi:hypothetical protein